MLLAALAAGSLSPVLGPTPARADETVDACVNAKDPDQAIAACSKLLDNAPGAPSGQALIDKVSAFVDRGLAHYNKDDYEHALADYEEALKLDPRNATAIRLRGFVYLSSKDYKRASADFDKALELAPNSFEAYAGRAMVRANLGDEKGAGADLKRAKLLNSDSEVVANAERSVKAALEAPKAAQTDQSQSGTTASGESAAGSGTSTASSDAEAGTASSETSDKSSDASGAAAAGTGTADACLKATSTDEAIAACSSFLDSVAGNVSGQSALDKVAALIGRGKAYYDKQDYAHAKGDFEAAIALAPNSADAYAGRAMARANLGDDKGAGSDLKRARLLNPDSDLVAAADKAVKAAGTDKAQGGMAADASASGSGNDTAAGGGTADSGSNAAQGGSAPGSGTLSAGCTDAPQDDAGAHRVIEACSADIEHDPQNAAAYDNRGLAHQTLNDAAAALEDYTKALAIAPDTVTYLIDRGSALDVLGKYEEAEAEFTKALKLDPKSALAYTNRAGVRGALGNADGAFDDVEAAFRIAPKAAASYDALGFALNAKGYHALALAAFQRALEIDPKDALANQWVGQEAEAVGAASAAPGTGTAAAGAGEQPATDGKRPEGMTGMPAEASETAAPAPSGAESLAPTVKAYNASGLKLLQQVADGSGNMVLSPYSIGTAMAMALSGARGDTAEEMAHVLEHSLASDAIDAGNMELLAKLRALPSLAGDDDTFALVTANALMTPFSRDAVSKDYAANLQKAYEAEMFSHLGLADINEWVSRKTRGKIDRLLEHLDDNVQLLLINTIYMRAKWHMQFDPGLTEKGTFHVSESDETTVPMMHSSSEYALAKLDGFRALSLPYVKLSLAMTILLPDDTEGAAKVLAGLDATSVGDIQAKLEAAEFAPIDLTLPRFKVHSRPKIVAAFQSLGMKLAFDRDKADFSGLTGPGTAKSGMAIHDIVHEADLEVSEVGTEAAAATAVELAPGAGAPGPTPPEEVVVDHPFVLLITERTTGAILFAGLITDPSKE